MDQTDIDRLKFLERVREYGLKCHRETNHMYAGYLPYEFHLRMVEKYCETFKKLIPAEDMDIVWAACWLHDVMEDCRQSFNDVRDNTNEQIAEIVYAVTNEKGRTRKDRANEKYYQGIKNTKYATFVKLCDRLANVQYSHLVKSDMIRKYRTEQEYFQYCLQHGSDYSQMWTELNALLTR